MIKDYLNEAIEFELNVCNLYMMYSTLNSEDHSFWYKLALEEGGHASILKNILSSINMVNHIFNINALDLAELSKTNDIIRKKCEVSYVNREDTFRTAMLIENSIGEIQYQKLIDSDIDDDIIKVFVKINNDEDRHLERIRDYISDNGINI